MPNTTSTQIPAGQVFYDRNMLVRAVSNFVHTRWGQQRDIPANKGEQIKFRRYGVLAAATTPLTEAVTPTGSQLSVTDITATPLQYGDYITLSDYVNFTTLDPLLTETSGILGDQAGDTLDQLTRDVLVAGTTVQYASTATSRVTVTSAMTLTVAEVREGVRTLEENKAKMIMEQIDAEDAYNTVPIGKAYVGIIGPRTHFDLKGETGYVPVVKYSSQANVMEDEKGAVDDVRFVHTPNAKIFTGAGAAGVDVYATIILARHAYGISRISGKALENIIKPLGSGQDPLNQRATSGWKATFVAKRLNESFMLRIEHGAS